MPVYVKRGDWWYDKITGEPLVTPDRICAPAIKSDIEPYKSPIDGRVISGRREQREDLERNGCVLSERPRQKFDREEYVERKRQQAKLLERHKQG